MALTRKGPAGTDSEPLARRPSRLLSTRSRTPGLSEKLTGFKALNLEELRQ